MGPLQTHNRGQKLEPRRHTSPCICSSLLPSLSGRAASHWSSLEPITVDREYAAFSLVCPASNGGGSPSPARWGPALPAGIMTDKAVAEADLMTLPPVREGLFSTAASPDICWCRARRRTRSLVALGPDASPSFEGGQRSPGRGRSAATESRCVRNQSKAGDFPHAVSLPGMLFPLFTPDVW